MQLKPISPSEANLLRETGGRPYVVGSKPGFPCRQCLRDGELGEAMILVSHDPFDSDSPYRCASPIFLHRDDCGHPDTGAALPDSLTIRQLSVRSFDRSSMMTDAAIIDGADLAETLSVLFEDDDVSTIHVHNAARGCWATSVGRISPVGA